MKVPYLFDRVFKALLHESRNSEFLAILMLPLFPMRLKKEKISDFDSGSCSSIKL